MILGKMKETAESYLGQPVSGAVVTVPAYFNDRQRQATKDAGRIANILVYDLGGGTFDVSVLEVDGQDFRVLATGGDAHLGGGDFDQRLMEYFIRLIKRKFCKEDISEDKKALGRLRKECETAKRDLSNQSQVRVEIESLFQGVDLSETLTRAKFNELNLDLFKKTLEVVEATLKDAKLGKSEIEEVVLVGGSTRIPKLREMLKEMFDGKEPCKGVNPDEAVAYGAAVFGSKLSDHGDKLHAGVTLVDVTPLSLGIEDAYGLMKVIIPRNTPVPTKMSMEFSTNEDQQTSMSTKVFQGERPLTKDCIHLGKFVLSDITPAPRGVTIVEDTLEIDEDGILKVTSREKIPGAKSKSLTITSYKGNLTQNQIKRMIKEAKEMAEQDKIARACVDARIELESYIYDAKNAFLTGDGLEQVGDKRGKVEIICSMRAASGWLDANQGATREVYEKKLNELRGVWDPILITAKKI
ncbi:unnamed protein product [Linum tenue]|uniref:Uncharacterized protein n=1 Tax=Linum tenue TaxID=586396 RepID=A0AAV0PEB2_9ROSI|nr:unnamed protein product [Linum tenue]